ncbi:MAG: potassium channel family protein [Frisingicoccus sp.]|nr:potassium channel family protein [Frisingicoccus sp.]
MRRLNILKGILKSTQTDKILISFVGFVFTAAFLIQIFDPNIDTYGNALWFCYAAITTIGFGDVTVVSPIAKIISVLLSIYAILVVAIVTGVVVNYYNQIIEIRQKDTMAAFIDTIQRLPELSNEELEEMSKKARKMVNGVRHH